MSCSSSSCSSCSANQSNVSDQPSYSVDPDINNISIQDLNQMIDYGINYWNEYNHKSNPLYWDDHLNQTGKLISINNSANMRPLLIILENLGPGQYYRLCKKMVNMELLGHKISWSWRYAKENLDQFCNLIENEDKGLLSYVNEQNELYSIINAPKQKLDRSISTKNYKSNESGKRSGLIQNLILYFIVFIIVLSIVNLVKVNLYL